MNASISKSAILFIRENGVQLSYSPVLYYYQYASHDFCRKMRRFVKTVLKSMYREGCSKIICFPISIEAARQYWHLLFLFYQNDFKDEQNHW